MTAAGLTKTGSVHVKCNQCPRPAFYMVGPESQVPICLDCYTKLAMVEHMEFVRDAVMMNQALDDMDAVSGFVTPGGRMPVAELVKMTQKSPTYNNINIQNSQVGVVSTGDLVRIDAAITLSKGSDADEVGRHIALLTQAVLDNNELSAESRSEIIELLQALSDQAITQRKRPVIKALAKSVAEKLSGVAVLASLGEKLWQAIERMVA